MAIQVTLEAIVHKVTRKNQTMIGVRCRCSQCGHTVEAYNHHDATYAVGSCLKIFPFECKHPGPWIQVWNNGDVALLAAADAAFKETRARERSAWLAEKAARPAGVEAWRQDREDRVAALEAAETRRRALEEDRQREAVRLQTAWDEQAAIEQYRAARLGLIYRRPPEKSKN